MSGTRTDDDTGRLIWAIAWRSTLLACVGGLLLGWLADGLLGLVTALVIESSTVAFIAAFVGMYYALEKSIHG